MILDMDNSKGIFTFKIIKASRKSSQ